VLLLAAAATAVEADNYLVGEFSECSLLNYWCNFQYLIAIDERFLCCYL
jgi:hypothetical protein